MKTKFLGAHQCFISHKHIEMGTMVSNVEDCPLSTESRESFVGGCIM